MNEFEITISIIAGIIGLFAGAESLVRGSSSLALRMGISPLVVGLTVVAFATSSPELVVSIKAALEGNPGIVIGNVVGSNIFNILGVLGFSSLLTPLSAPGVSLIDWIVMVLFAILLLPLAWTGRTLDRREGAFFLLSYCLYMWWLWSAN